MNQVEMTQFMAKKAGISKAAAGRILKIIALALVKELVTTGKTRFPDFGTFQVKTRAARTFHNPHTHAPVKKGPRNTVTFKPLTAVKLAVQDKQG